MAIKQLVRSFAGGEIGPLLHSRADLDKFQTGLDLCENFVVQPQGPIENRPGFGYVKRTKYDDRKSRLIPFAFNTLQTFVIEFGHQYIRFHTQGAPLLGAYLDLLWLQIGTPALFHIPGHGYTVGEDVYIGEVPNVPLLSNLWGKVSSVIDANTFTVSNQWGVDYNSAATNTLFGKVYRPYEIPSPYTEDDLDEINFVQSADVLTLVHPSYDPRELRRYGATDWRLEIIQFTSALSPPRSNSTPPSAILHEYAVSAVVSGYTLTALSTPATCMNDLTIPGYVNVVAWGSVPGGLLYHVYKRVGGVWGWIGVAPSGQTFRDDGTVTPNVTAQLYAGAGTPPVISATAVAPASTGVTVTPTGAGTTTYEYVVTSLDDQGAEESIASGVATANNDLTVSGNSNFIQWPAVPGVSKYGIYRRIAGVFARIGVADASCEFRDQNILPDASITPPLQINPFQGTGNFPRAVSYFEQRRVFAGTNNAPQNVWATRSGTERNLGYSFPSRDDDSITIRVVARQAQSIRHIVPMDDMLLLTSGGEWKVAAPNAGALTPTNVAAKQQGAVGSSICPPIMTDRSVIFPQARGSALRELDYSWQQQGYQTRDITILAPHLFQQRTVKQMALAQSPTQVIWAVRDDGVLLGLTYTPEHEVRAWHRHTTDGFFESVCSVSEGDEDAVYVIVRRTINGVSVRQVERLHTRLFDEPADAFFVDSGLTYDGAETQTISRLDHLEGMEVAVLADGGVVPGLVVTNGQITLDAPARKVQIGLPYVSRARTLPLSFEAQALGQGLVKNVNKVYLRVLRSSGFSAGPTFDKLTPYPTRLNEDYGQPPDLVTGEVPITIEPMWQRDGAICVQQSDPTPCSLLSMALEVETGGG